MLSKWLLQYMEIIHKHMHVFHMSTELNCILIDELGKTIYEEGAAAPFCTQFQEVTAEKCPCDQAHLYASKQSEMLGEAYVFFCPGGLVKFTMAIVTQNIFRGAIVAGPIQMNVPDAYFVDNLIKAYDLQLRYKASLQSYFKMVPMIDPIRVRNLNELLQIMVRDIVGDEKYEIKKKKDFYHEQRIINENIQEIKEQQQSEYPIHLEEVLAAKVRYGDSKGAVAVLNELLGYILFKYKGNRTVVISMMIELLVVMSRAAVAGGAKYEEIVASNTKFYEDAFKTTDIEEVCIWMVQLLEKFTQFVFNFDSENVENKNIIRKALMYIHEKYQKEITLEEVAEHVGLSTTYFSRMFSKETQRNFTEYINMIRVEESKKLLLDLNYSLCDIAISTGFSDQSYFSKVFKKHEGISPGMYRKNHQG